MYKSLLVLMAVLTLAACDVSTPDRELRSSETAAPADFFRGRNLTYIVSTNPGGGYDTYARLIAKHMQGKLPVDNIIIENIPGAGMIIGNNILWGSRPDGLTIGTFNAGFIYNQLVGNDAIAFQVEKFEYIGKASSEPRSLIVSSQCAIDDMADLLASTEAVTFATPGVGSGAYIDILLIQEALGLNLKFITGYTGNEEQVSLLRGDVCAVFGTTSTYLPLVDNGDARIILTVAGKIDGIPTAIDYARTPRARKIINLIATIERLGRVTAGPPGIPPDRPKVLQDAYRAAVTSPALVEEAARIGLPVDYMDGGEVKQHIIEALDQDPELIALLKSIIHSEDNKDAN